MNEIELAIIEIAQVVKDLTCIVKTDGDAYLQYQLTNVYRRMETVQQTMEAVKKWSTNYSMKGGINH